MHASLSQQRSLTTQNLAPHADTIFTVLHKFTCACMQLMWFICTSLAAARHVMFQPLLTIPLSKSVTSHNQLAGRAKQRICHMLAYLSRSACRQGKTKSFASKVYIAHNHLAGRARQELCQECNEVHSGCLSNQLVPHTTSLCASPCRHTVSGPTIQNRQPHETGVLWGNKNGQQTRLPRWCQGYDG